MSGGRTQREESLQRVTADCSFIPEIPPTSLRAGSSVGLSPPGHIPWLTNFCTCTPCLVRA